MKAIIVSLLFIILLSSFALSQECDSCGCATKPTYTSPDPATFIGGKLKPNRSDLNNADPTNYFPILIVFVQSRMRRETAPILTSNLGLQEELRITWIM